MVVRVVWLAVVVKVVVVKAVVRCLWGCWRLWRRWLWWWKCGWSKITIAKEKHYLKDYSPAHE